MYIPDLGAYNYSLSCELGNVVAVGWLSWTHPFPTGDMDPALLAKLKLLATTQSANPMWGFSDCELCGVEEVLLEAHGVRHYLGGAEVWIPHRTDAARIFAAPDLIVHYIEEHDYLPPEAFLDALAGVDPARWNGALEAERILEAARVERDREPG